MQQISDDCFTVCYPVDCKHFTGTAVRGYVVHHTKSTVKSNFQLMKALCRIVPPQMTCYMASHSGVDGLDGGRVHPQATTAAHHSTAAHRESQCSGATSQSGRADREASSPLSAVRCCSQSVCLRLMNTLSSTNCCRQSSAKPALLVTHVFPVICEK